MIRSVTLLVTIFILGLPVPVLAAEAGNGTIEGQVVNKTKGGSSVAGQDITLKTYLNDSEVGSTTTKTDAEGRFVFDGLSTDSGYSYQVTLNFQKAEYNSKWLSFDEGETSKSVEIIVYDSTTSDEAIKVETSHTIIYIKEERLQVKEYFLFVNEADRTYIGSNDTTSDRSEETLIFSLPREATKFKITRGLMECCIYGHEGGFADTMPFLPGVKEVAYSYEVDHAKGEYIFRQRVNYPTNEYHLLVEGKGLEVSSDRLTTQEPLNIKGTSFKHLSGKDLGPGDTLVAHLSGLPQTSNRGTVMWVVLALVVLACGFGFGYLRRKKRLQPVSPEGSPDQIRQRLLFEIAQLDDDFEGGKIPEENYRRLRAQRKAELIELIQRSKEESSGNYSA